MVPLQLYNVMKDFVEDHSDEFSSVADFVRHCVREELRRRGVFK